MVRPLGLIVRPRASRLADGEVANVDHLLHSPSPSARILPDSSETSLPRSLFCSRKAVAELSDGFATDRPGRGAHLANASARGRHLLVIVWRCSRNLPNDLPSIGEIFSWDLTTAVPVAGESTRISSVRPRFLRTDVILMVASFQLARF